ncbi:unnamed protein product [Candidula unifasciata]|uniref:Uncharacterized protein n=1 Tax=Candidula unifasciata TaxID=100452 RepID=A0A8S3YJK2_9EUPU|nr:unnamed protein product [Candidula unifasciata]
MPGEAGAIGQQVDLPDQTLLRLLQTFNVNISEPLFWCVLMMFVFEPFHRCVIVGQGRFRNVMTHHLGTKLTFRIYCILSISYSVLTFFLFQKAVNSQPRMRDLQRNEALLVGYVFALAGFIIKAHIHMTSSIASIMGGQYFGIDVPRKTAFPGPSDRYYHPLGTSSVMCYFGLSVIRASAAGILTTIILGVSTILASQLERCYHETGAKAKLQQRASTGVPGSLGDGDRRAD